MVVRFGRGECPEGFLPVFSVNDEEEARRLIVATCGRGEDGEYYSKELAREQNLDVLQAFSDKLARTYALISR